MSIDLNSEFWAAVFGAIVGGAITAIVQWLTILDNRREERRNREATNKSLARTALFKTIRIFTNIHGLNEHLEESYRSANEKSHQEPFAFVLPISNLPEHVNFSPDEIGMVMDLKCNKLISSMLDLDIIHNNLVEVFQEHKRLSENLKEKMPANMFGNIGESSFTEEQWMIVRPRMVEINILLQQAKVMTNEYVKTAESVLNTLHEKIEDKIKLGIELERTK